MLCRDEMGTRDAEAVEQAGQALGVAVDRVGEVPRLIGTAVDRVGEVPRLIGTAVARHVRRNCLCERTGLGQQPCQPVAGPGSPCTNTTTSVVVGRTRVHDR